MKNILVISFLITSLVYSQDTIYLDNKYEITENNSNTVYFQTLNHDGNSKLTTEQIFFKNGELKFEKIYENYNSKNKSLIEKKHYYPNGQLHINSNLKKEKYHGNFFSYWENGQMKRKDIYKNGKIKEGDCWDNQGKLIDYYDFESHPQFPGGSSELVSYISNNFDRGSIPPNSKENRVIVKFEIDIDGKVKNVTLKESVNPLLEKEIMRLFSTMPNWEPATQDGNKVKVFRSMPLAF